MPFAPPCRLSESDTLFVTLPLSGFSLIVGILNAVDTFASQAWGAGPEHYKQVGESVQRGIAIGVAAIIPMSLVYLFAVKVHFCGSISSLDISLFFAP